MQKIPTLFVRDPQDMSRVTREVTPGCEWVLAGEGLPTRKYDGTNVRVTVSRGFVTMVEKRRNPTRAEKANGAEPGYVAAIRTDPADQHIFAAVDGSEFRSTPDGAWSCEALGPKIQGGADGLGPCVIGFGCPGFADAARRDGVPRTFDGIREYLSEHVIEGLVWHHPDGRMAKIKRRDFGLRWPEPSDAR